MFNAAERGETIGLIDGWVGVVAFSLQIYFDFSGYSDMASEHFLHRNKTSTGQTFTNHQILDDLKACF